MPMTEYAPVILLLALALDALLGEPNWLWRRLPHPIVSMGRLIAATDQRFNRENDPPWRQRLCGILAVGGWTAIAAAPGLALVSLAATLPMLPIPAAILAIPEAILVAILLAQRSLYEHVDAVRLAFERTGLAGARQAVSMIVGRNPDTLNAAAVCRASIESAAENFSDGVVAPAFWYLVAGLPGMLAYKMINTADSMVGHRTPRHEAFGWAAARLDDIVNLAPARLAAVIIVIAAPFAGFSGRAASMSVWRDAGRHRSPNAGWPEAAMAGALGLALAGPRTYGTQTVADAWLNGTGRQKATPADIARALRLMLAAGFVMAGFIMAGAAAALIFR